MGADRAEEQQRLAKNENRLHATPLPVCGEIHRYKELDASFASAVNWSDVQKF